MKKFVIKLNGVSKKYVFHHEKPTLVENIFSRKKREEFWALKDINLTIEKGERIGIIGANGSGKTTLLEIIAGITTPTKGDVHTRGKIVGLIELEAGFHPDLTGEENIYLNGLLVGMFKEEVRKKLKIISSFADLGSFIDVPFYTYSEGMKLRLGFSIIAHMNPDVILLDENMAVGDQRFREKSYKKIREFFEKGKTIILVSQWMDLIEEHCDRVFWLDKGEIKMEGKTKKVIRSYQKSLS